MAIDIEDLPFKNRDFPYVFVYLPEGNQREHRFSIWGWLETPLVGEGVVFFGGLPRDIDGCFPIISPFYKWLSPCIPMHIPL